MPLTLVSKMGRNSSTRADPHQFLKDSINEENYFYALARIRSQRRKVKSFRNSTNSESFDRDQPTSSGVDFNHLMEVSRYCVKETLDFVVLYNRRHENTSDFCPQEYREMVDFCTTLVASLKKKPKRSLRKRVKDFFRIHLK